MANTYKLIASNTLTSATATVTFSSISTSYTDLNLVLSTRASSSSWGTEVYLRFNSNSSSIYSYVAVGASNAAAFDAQLFLQNLGAGSLTAGNSSTSNAFGFTQFYIPSYQSSSNKVFSIYDSPGFNSVTNMQFEYISNLFGSTSAISSITIGLVNGSNFLTNSSFYLYGISNT